MAGVVFRVCMGGPNISGVQISCDRPYIMLTLLIFFYKIRPNFCDMVHI